LSPAPDGSAFGYEPNGKGGFHLFFDQLGNPIGTAGSSVFYQSEMWADDSRHLCSLDGSGGQWRLGFAQPGETPNHTNVVALDPAIAQSGIIAVSFAACSANSNGGAAVIEYSYTSRPTEYWVVRIADGAILQQRTYPAGQVENVTASMDGTLIAENSGATLIRRASDLSLVTRLDPSLRVLAFSGDDSSVLVSTAPMGAGLPANQEVLGLQTGRVIWRGEGTSAVSSFAAQPGGNAFAVALTTDGNPPGTVLIIYGDGSRPAKLPGLFKPIW
jgi:type II secretory pathway pseudopilin PulG